MADIQNNLQDTVRPRTGDITEPPRGRPPVALPDWMRNPEPAKVTMGRQVTAAVLRLPGGPMVRRAWWRWQRRRRLHRRFPILVPLVAMPLAFIATMALLSFVYWLFARIWATH
ncbi:hypothetical protein ACN27F_17920 [Solwaraspora sp. WMMB335]|uniref:hypothetical protein n=1 Tax=Solwaraspora sp. WMMB335 TaxID=3404118 RepID=UPI003B93173B